MNKQYISMTKLSMLLSMGLLLLAQFANAQPGTRENQTGSAFANNSPWSPALKEGKIEEVIGKRTRNAKHFIKPDGTFTMYTSPASIHYQDGGMWKEIDLTVHQNTTGQHMTNPYYNGENSFKTWYPQHPMNGAVYTKLNEGEINENLQSMYAVDASGNTVYQYTSNPTTTASVDNSTVTYSSIFPNTNIRYSLQNDGRKFDVVLQNNQCLNVLPSTAKYIVLKEKMMVPSSWTVVKNQFGYNVYDGQKLLINFLQPYAVETESSSKNYENGEELMKEGKISVVKTGNELIVITKFDVSWLKSSSRVFPLTLDPTVSYTPTIVSMASGNMTGPTAPKSSGNIRLGTAGAITWCQFNISSFPSGATISTSTYWGNHFNGTGVAKIAAIVGMQTIDPITSSNTAINTQINTTGPVYNNTYTFSGTTVPSWYSGSLGGTANGDIVTQQAQGWTALGFKYASGNTATMIQYGYNAAVSTNIPYLSIDYSTSGCSGSPVGGNATSSVALACGDPFLLNLTGNSTGSGMTYQWQSSPPGANTWTSLGTPSSSSVYSVTQSSATDYQCIVTCSTSGLSSTSTIISVGQNSVINCYCIPTGIAPPSSNFITSFSTTGALQNITNAPTTYSTSPVNGYGDYTSMVVAGNPGTTINFTVYFSSVQNLGIWADWNQDGDFTDLGETLISTTTGNTVIANSFTIPVSALTGPTRLRVRGSSSGVATPCGNSLYGEAEDYTINVLGPCTTASAGTIATTTYSICPGTPQLLTATAPLFSLGTTYKWQESTVSGGPYTDVAGGSGSTTLSYTTAGLAPGTYYYVLQTTCANCGPCSVISNQVTVNVNNVPAPTATNSAQCAPGVPTAFVTSTAGSLGTGNYNWYSALTGGTLLQSMPYGPVQTYYTNDFSSTTLTNSYKTASVSITGGALQLHPNVVGQYGAFGVAASNYQSEKYLVDFDYTTSGTLATMGEGFSYSFGNDADTGVSSTMNAENGTGSKLKVAFVASASGGSTAGIYLMYNCSVNEQTPTTSGVIGYSPNVAWKNNSGHVTIAVDSLGKASVTVNGTPIFTNVVIPLTPSGTLWKGVNRSTWKHVWKGRTLTNSMLTTFDNIVIKQDTLTTGTDHYLSSVPSTTTFYVSEIGTNGCSSVRTPVTVTVNTPATITATSLPNDSICPGTSVTLNATGAITYLWNGNATSVNGDTTFNAMTASTYTVTGTDGNGCTNTSTIQLYLHPVLTGTATATPAAVCPGGSTSLTAFANPICTGLNVNKFADYYAIANWTFFNFTTNGTLNTSYAPDSVKISSGTSGPGTGGQTMLSRVITCAGTVSFAWNFTTPYDNYLDYPQYEINNNGRVTFPTYNTSLYGPGLQSGTMSIPVAAGDVIKIYSTTDDNDGDAGILTIKNFIAPSQEITPIYSYYDAPTGGISLGTPPLTVTPASTGGTVTYYAAFTSSTTGCVNPIRVPVNVTVHPVPTATVSGGGSVCTGSTLPDVSIALTGTGPWNMTYTDGTTQVSITGITTNPYIITGAAVGTYSVTTLNDANCSAGTSTGSATVSLIPLPTATVSGGGPVCVGAPLPDVNIALTGTSPWNLTYTDGTTPVTVNGILASPYTIVGAAPGTYSVVSVSDATCTGTGSGSVTVVINPLPTVSGTITPSSVCYANSATPSGSGAVTYTWNNGLTDNTPFVATSSTTYVVTGTDANGCSSTGSAVILVNGVSTNLAQASSGNLVSNTGSSNGSSTQPDGSMVMYSDPSCNLIASVQDTPGGNSLGATTTSVTVEPSVMTWPVVGGQPYTRRWFTITPTNNSGVNATVTLYQTQADFDDYNASNGAYPDLPTGPTDLAGIANIRVTKVSGGVLGVGSAGVITPTSVIWNSTTNYWELTFTVTGTFSHFFIHAANPLGSALPASIISFTGKKEGSSDVLTWTTSSEQNNAYFNLQHSTDGKHFATIEKVSSKAVNGQSNVNLNYQVIHLTPSSGHNYYRLEQVDIDGNNNINEKVVDLIWGVNGSQVTIYPNPVKNILNLDVYTNQVSNLMIKLMDMTGRTIKTSTLKSTQGMNTVLFDMSEFSNGIYTITVLENKTSIFTEKVRKAD